MTDLVSFRSIKEQDLVRFRDCRVVSDVSNVDAAIREDQLRGLGVFFSALMPTPPAAERVVQLDNRRLQQPSHFNFRQATLILVSTHRPPPQLAGAVVSRDR